MPAPGPWTFCYTTPDGERTCIDIPVVIEWPWEIDQPDPVILDQLGRLQALAGEVTEPTLKMQLTQALDVAAGSLSDQLPAGFEFRRADTRDLLDETVNASPLDDVTGLFYVTGWTILHNAGYAVIQERQAVSPDNDAIIVGQQPSGGTLSIPPGPVTIWVGFVPPAFNPPPPPPPEPVFE
jgi:hypothetical protein